MHLLCEFFVSRPLFAQEQLDALQQTIDELLPSWSVGLRVARDENSPNGIVVGRADRLFSCIHQVARPKRGMGSAVLTGSYEGVSFFLTHCEGEPPPELNELTIEVYGPPTVEGQPTSAWARAFFEAMTVRLPISYGNVHSAEEFAAKNMIDDETGVRAVGRLLGKSLPGLYWLNYFGRPYVDLMGRERLLSAPAYEAKPAGDGVLVMLDASPESWQTIAYRHREQATLAHLGKQFFFSHSDPDRKTIAPDFRSPRD